MKRWFHYVLFTSAPGGYTMYWAVVIGVIIVAGYLVGGLIPKRFPDFSGRPPVQLQVRNIQNSQQTLQLRTLVPGQETTNPGPVLTPPPVKTVHEISNPCLTPVQLCTPKDSTQITTSSVLKVTITASPTHCSSVRVHIFVDGQEKTVTPWLGWVNAPAPFNTLPRATSEINLGPVSPGAHTLEFQGEGQVGGCNSGVVGWWGGTVDITTSS